MLADTSMSNVVMRLSTSLCAVLRVASRLQCSVASSCARTAGSGEPASGSPASGGGAAGGCADAAPSCIDVEFPGIGFLRYSRPAAGAGAWVISISLVGPGSGQESAAIMNSVLLCRSPERAGIAAAVQLDDPQHLAALADAHAALVRDIGVPDGAFGVQADAVGGGAVAGFGPYPAGRQASVRADIERGELAAVGLGHDQRRVVGRDDRPVREREPIGRLPGWASSSIWRCSRWNWSPGSRSRCYPHRRCPGRPPRCRSRAGRTGR